MYKEILKLARLARVQLREDEVSQLGDDVERILAFMKGLQEVNTEGISPLVSPVDESCSMRNDVSSSPPAREDILKNAPFKQKDFFSIPKVMDLGEN
jgi:aspartyl-tRNA(Asn)/glutamyl-tRNA(Gln) amidotransferase subunit C